MNTTTPRPDRPPQLTFKCKLADCDVSLELKTHGETKDGVHRWTFLSAEALISPPKPRKVRGFIPASKPAVSISFSLSDLSDCHLTRYSWRDTLSVGRTSFETRKQDFTALAGFLSSLGIDVEDETKKGDKS